MLYLSIIISKMMYKLLLYFRKVFQKYKTSSIIIVHVTINHNPCDNF